MCRQLPLNIYQSRINNLSRPFACKSDKGALRVPLEIIAFIAAEIVEHTISFLAKPSWDSYEKFEKINFTRVNHSKSFNTWTQYVLLIVSTVRKKRIRTLSIKAFYYSCTTWKFCRTSYRIWHFRRAGVVFLEIERAWITRAVWKYTKWCFFPLEKIVCSAKIIKRYATKEEIPPHDRVPAINDRWQELSGRRTRLLYIFWRHRRNYNPDFIVTWKLAGKNT